MPCEGAMREAFQGHYRGKKVIVTGHTGFKGSWLALWLHALGADVVGYSAYLPSDPCNFLVCELEKVITHTEGDVRDFEHLGKVFLEHQPEMVFHLAAQPIVRKAYDQPQLTFETNVTGTINVLEAVRACRSVRVAVIITSDKCYHNVEWVWGYRENDRLGGDDPYSASKACAEIASQAYIRSYFSNPESPRIATTRAGNVIGGGDWAEARIVPDCVRAWAKGETALVRSPSATRPWQHVLEPLSGYLWLGAHLGQSERLHGEAFNFGPDQKVNQSVAELISLFLSYWGDDKWEIMENQSTKKESTLLKLSCDKALHLLGWHPVLSFEESIRLTAEWYREFYADGKNMRDFSLRQIGYYVDQAIKQNLSWVKDR